ncbi:MAG: VC0807 family protein [Rubrivivax sp.]
MNTATKPNPLLEIAVTIVAPSLVLMSASGPLGPTGALLAALALPVGYGLWDGWRRRRLNWLALVGVLSTLLTGGIGLMQLDAQWLAVKEAAVPALMGLVIAASAWTRRPLIHALVFDAALLDTARIQSLLAARGQA